MITYSDKFIIQSIGDLTDLIEEAGFVPFFANEIPGFSIEEHIDPKCWYGSGADEFWAAWEWKGPVIKSMRCAYGKFLKNKAMYISRKCFPDFANVRRDGYDFDARCDEGLAPLRQKELYELIGRKAPVLTKELKDAGGYGKDGKRDFDATVTKLQSQCYVLISDFKYREDRNGNKYGWGEAEYSTPEIFMGKAFKNAVYKRSPEESYERLLKHFGKILPYADEKIIGRILKR